MRFGRAFRDGQLQKVHGLLVEEAGELRFIESNEVVHVSPGPGSDDGGLQLLSGIHSP
jgi:hypothetical protein